MQTTIDKARAEFCEWYENIWLAKGDIQVVRLFLDSALEYENLLSQEEQQELE